MVPAILILSMAWTLKAMTDSLGATAFVETAMKASAKSFHDVFAGDYFPCWLPAGLCHRNLLGTFGILIPIVVGVFENSDPTLMVISVSACMAGAVCGDHCSPISDTTIMASAGAQCDHVNHVSTQLPYAITVAVISFVTYIVAGFVRAPFIALPVGMILVFIVLL